MKRNLLNWNLECALPHVSFVEAAICNIKNRLTWIKVLIKVAL